MQKLTKRRGIAIMLILAMLIVATAVILPIVTAADPAEFDDVGYQTLSALDLADDEDTDLRFFFTIGKLTYDEVGFVFSKSNATPTVGGANCYKKSIGTVYSTITANGTPMAAPAGRYYVAVKMTDIPHAYFDGSLYVRPYVIDGGETKYDDAQTLTVCSADGHTHVIRELKHEMIGGTAAMNVVGTKVGYCAGCKLDNVTQYDATTSLEYKRWAGGGANDSWIDVYKVSDILAGGKHFYPDASNNYEGNDLYAEYSVLWNETLLNLSPTQESGARLETQFAPNETGSSNYKALAYWSLTNNVSDSGAKIAGAFEYPCPDLSTSAPGNPYPKMTTPIGDKYEDFPNVGGDSENYPEWGWHRIGVKYHQDVTNLSDVRDNGDPAEYKLTVTVYLDGEVISILSGTSLAKSGNDYKLYTVTGGGEAPLNYTDINGNLYFQNFKLYNYCAIGSDAYFIDGDFFVTCGQSFVHPVTRIDNPAARTEVVNGKTFTAPFYYTTVGAHEHVWGELVNDASHAADCGTPATQSIHCTVCGAVKGGSTVNLSIDPSLHNWNLTPVRTQEPTLLVDGIDRYTCTVCGAHDDRPAPYEHNVQIFTTSTSGNYDPYKASLGSIRGSEHFYTPGNDLLIEYSILWNETLTNLSVASYKDKQNKTHYYTPYIDTRLTTNEAGSNNKNIIYWSLADNVHGSDCEYAGGFEWGGIDNSEPDNPYPKFTGAAHNGGLGTGTNRNEYPNIGGANGGDGTPQGDPQWGWHRVSIRYRNEVTNIDAVKDGADATYNLEMWVYIDGVLVIHASETDHKADNGEDRKLFSAASNGAGGITYTENDSQYLHGAFLCSKKMASGKGYFEIADYSVTIGSDFVQDVQKVTSPTSTTFEVQEGVFIPTTMWYELKP